MSVIYITEDGEKIEATGEALQAVLDVQAIEAKKAKEADDQEKATAKAKQAILDRLGITADEAALLLK